MHTKIRNLLGFPYAREYEEGFHQSLLKSMYKPLLVAVFTTLLLIGWLVVICIFTPELIAPPEYVDGLLRIHLTFMFFTILVLFASVSFRRQYFLRPNLYVLTCNTYSVGILLWASVLSAYAHYSVAIYTAYVFVSLCVSMISLFKAGMAIISFAGNFILYIFMLSIYTSIGEPAIQQQIYSAGLASIASIVISFSFYRFRAKTYYDKVIIDQQLQEINQMNRKLQRLVYIDNLTELYNRRFYGERLPSEIKKQADQPLCCVMADIDYFKQFNDHYGHPAGDECLRSVARLIKEYLPEDAFVIRYGGEEFFCLLSIPSAEEALALVNTLRDAIESEYLIHSVSPFGKVTLSCGLCFVESNQPKDLAQMTAQADKALYQSKRKGRNVATLYQPKTTDG